jgi:myo-inositol-1(or 4)-monophosphatase
MIARRAGALLREAYSQPHHIDFKGEVNLVTQTDRDSEALIVEALTAEFPGTAILAEESGAQPGSNGLTWIVDPLDGTNNFAHGYPVFAVSIALWASDGPLAGVVYDPLRDECFCAARGQGATLNGEPTRVSPTQSLLHSILATGYPYDHHTALDANTAASSAFLRRAQDLRRSGAAALDLAYVACGRLDGFWEMGLDPWDVGAGLLLVREAGGMVSRYNGDPDLAAMLHGHNHAASNGLIHGEMLAALRDVYDFADDGSFTLKQAWLPLAYMSLKEGGKP